MPGTAADVLCAPGRPWELPAEALDGRDWWFRTSFAAHPAAAGEEAVLVFEGLATVAEAYLNGRLIHSSGSMFDPGKPREQRAGPRPFDGARLGPADHQAPGRSQRRTGGGAVSGATS